MVCSLAALALASFACAFLSASEINPDSPLFLAIANCKSSSLSGTSSGTCETCCNRFCFIMWRESWRAVNPCQRTLLGLLLGGKPICRFRRLHRRKLIAEMIGNVAGVFQLVRAELCKTCLHRR